jgi:16S rRNA (guanine(527)-N(7))-methyltransferase RsmG
VFHVKHVPCFEEARDDCRSLGVELSREEHAQLERFASVLERESARTNLTGPAEIERLWSRHLLESLSYSPLLDKGSRVVDVGSGAGFPGIVLAIQGFDILLLEPRRKRFVFLSRALEELELDDVAVARKKLKSFGTFPPGTQFVARSVLEPGKLLAQMAEVAEGAFTCTRRYGPDDRIPEAAVSSVLPSPPLDRPGVMVQYRHPDRLTPSEREDR